MIPKEIESKIHATSFPAMRRYLELGATGKWRNTKPMETSTSYFSQSRRLSEIEVLDTYIDTNICDMRLSLFQCSPTACGGNGRSLDLFPEISRNPIPKTREECLLAKLKEAGAVIGACRCDEGIICTACS